MKKTWNAFSAVVLGILIGAESWLAITILRLNMLPDRYLYLLLGALIVSILVTALLVFKRKSGWHEKKSGHGRQIFGYVIALLLTAASLAGSYLLSHINQTISEVTKTPVETDIVNVFVRAEDPAQAIQDAMDYHFAVSDSFDWENTQITVQELEDQFGHALHLTNYSSVPEMYSALMSGEVDAMILNISYISILESLEEFADFWEVTRILAEHTIESVPTTPLPDVTENQISSEPTEQVKTGVEAPFVIYLSGSDTRSSKLHRSNSDVNILVIVNPETKQILLVNTPRDYYLPNPAGKDSMDKLTHHGIYGIQNSMKTLSKLYEAEIAYYGQINFTGFEKLIDAIGGVDVESVSSFYMGNDWYASKGINHFNGAQALAFARNRMNVSGGDNGRGKNQMRVITAVIKKLTSSTKIITNYTEIMDSLKGMFVTNFTHDEISTLVKMQLSDMATWNIQSYAVTGTGGSNKNYSIGGGLYSYVMYPHENAVAHAIDLIDRVIAGESLTAEDMTLPK